MQVPTIKIAAPGWRGWKIINADKFNAATMDVYTDQPASRPIPTRDRIAIMGKVELREWLEAHGADVPKSVTDMRAALLRVMFVEV